jgi:hypothetical protein
MDIDVSSAETLKTGDERHVVVSSVQSLFAEASSSPSSVVTVEPALEDKGKDVQADEDVEMVDVSTSRPPLPSRKKTVVSDSVMMFGE